MNENCKKKHEKNKRNQKLQFYYTCTKKYHFYIVSEDKGCYKESQYSTKTKYILLIHSPEDFIFGIQQSHVDQKIATI